MGSETEQVAFVVIVRGIARHPNYKYLKLIQHTKWVLVTGRQMGVKVVVNKKKKEKKKAIPDWYPGSGSDPSTHR